MRKVLEQIHYEDKLAVLKLSRQLVENYKPNSLIVNIGTDSLLYDSVGPMIGTMLKKEKDLVYTVVGTLEEPIDFGNLDKMLGFINERHPNSFIIGIDSAISTSLGNITFYRGPIYPGLGSGKKARPIGNISIIAGMGVIVEDLLYLTKEASGSVNTYSSHTVYGCAKTICNAILEADRYIKEHIL